MTSPTASALLEDNCLHVAPSDNAFTARMRLHQSWYRRHVLGVPPGPNPSARGALYGNMLRPEDGRSGGNFLSQAIHAAAEARMGESVGVVEQQRLRNNLLSSQPLCFNVFGPLANDGVLATQLIRSLPGVPTDIQATQVFFEYAPTKDEHLGDGTAFDAFILYERAGGVRGFLGIETKLTEPFSQDEYPFDLRYSRWHSSPDWWWQPGSEATFPKRQYNQLWRNHLLAFAMLRRPVAEFSEGFCVVLYPRGDSACNRAIKSYRRHLLPSGAATVLEWHLDETVERWMRIVTKRADQEWLKALRLRYLELDASETAWRLHRGKR